MKITFDYLDFLDDIYEVLKNLKALYYFKRAFEDKDLEKVSYKNKIAGWKWTCYIEYDWKFKFILQGENWNLIISSKYIDDIIDEIQENKKYIFK